MYMTQGLRFIKAGRTNIVPPDYLVKTKGGKEKWREEDRIGELRENVCTDGEGQLSMGDIFVDISS